MKTGRHASVMGDLITTPATGRVVILSNRLPITARRDGATIRMIPSSGGLVAGLRQVAKRWPVVWLGWNGMAQDAADSGEVTRLDAWEGGSLGEIPLAGDEVSRFYRRYCNSVLWPILHGLEDDIPPDLEDWETYRRVNRRFADAALRQLRPGDRIWVHDYHLLLVPALIRERAPDVPIAFFLHTPFPEPRIFAEVPQHAELVSGMLGADVVGFHTEEYSWNFMCAATAAGHRTIGRNIIAGGRRTAVKTRPMGIDVNSFARLGNDPDVLAEVARLKTAEPALLLGVDRLDPTKGIPQRLLAFECLLDQHPELRGYVSLAQIAVPSREEIKAYRDLKQVVESLVERINRRFGRPSWTPVHYLYDTVDLNTLVSLYRATAVMVVTPQRDGLNLVAKEFIATRSDGDGVLILSKFAGAAAELRSALTVNPNHVTELANVYYQALTMPPAERRRRMLEMRRVIDANNVIGWASEFLDGLPAAVG
ncbi:MAG: alpha,alpha-trehalose-phosphate synthase (UDP-forming) [Gemmatimonadota bacterium]